MSALTCLSEEQDRAPANLQHVRVSGGVHIRCAERMGKSRIVDIAERDGYKVRSPRRSSPPEAVIINTGGGIAGGDKVHQNILVEDKAKLTVTSQASERVYRSANGATATVDIDLKLEEESHLNWLPQETILFNNHRFKRRIEADIGTSAELLIAETVIFGRTAMGETITNGFFSDCWRIRRGGKLAFAENILLTGNAFENLSKKALAGVSSTATTLLFVSPCAEDKIGPVRAVLDKAGFDCAASAWNGMLAVRGLSPGPEAIRKLLATLVPLLTQSTLPRVWWT